MNLDYDGTPSFRRKRQLTEIETERRLPQPQPDAEQQATLEREEGVDQLYKDVAQTYLKAKLVKDALAEMEPLQWIPIEQQAEQVVIAAKRRAPEESVNGTRITFRMFQAAIADCLRNNRDLAKKLSTSSNFPVSHDVSTKTSSDNGSNLISRFYEGSGVAGSILAALTLAPTQMLGFQLLSTEESATKAFFSGQMIAGIAILLALGAQAESIQVMFSNQQNSAQVLAELDRQKNNPYAQDEALRSVGIDPDELRANLSIPDAEHLVRYVRDYSARHGGVFQDYDHLTMDHWAAYASASRSTAVLEDILDTAPAYSNTIRNLSGSNDPSARVMPIASSYASTIHGVRSDIEKSIDDIANVFMYQLTDDAFCCLVEITGELDTTILRNMSRVLRILALDLNGIMIGFHNRLLATLRDASADLILEFLDDMNQFYVNLVADVEEALNIQDLSACIGLFISLEVLIRAPHILIDKIRKLALDLLARIEGLTMAKDGAWAAAADRRMLLSIARLLDVVATRIESTVHCRLRTGAIQTAEDQVIREQVADDAIRQILERPQPILNISPEDQAKLFSGTQPTSSKVLSASYQMGDQQGVGTGLGIFTSDCNQRMDHERLESLRRAFVDSFRQT